LSRLTVPATGEKMVPMARPLRSLAVVLAFGALLAACTSDGDTPAPSGPSGGGQKVNAMMASTDLYAGAKQRVGIGFVTAQGTLVSYGSVDFRFSYVGTANAPQQPAPGPTATAVYLPTPGTANSGSRPTLTQPAQARGIYVAEDVTFDRAGFWRVDIAANVSGLGAISTSTTFGVTAEPALPAPGQPALKTDNLTIGSKGVPPGAIDSRAADGGDVPDPELHRWTIADAIAQHRPAVVIFSTPVFCVSRFCGPVTDEVEQLAKRFSDRAVFIHVEIWRDYQKQAINQAAADWLYRNGDLTEPWLYEIGADGTIVDRWSVLFREDEVAAWLESLPKMKG
jgi:hypothetical protein